VLASVHGMQLKSRPWMMLIPSCSAARGCCCIGEGELIKQYLTALQYTCSRAYSMLILALHKSHNITHSLGHWTNPRCCAICMEKHQSSPHLNPLLGHNCPIFCALYICSWWVCVCVFASSDLSSIKHNGKITAHLPSALSAL